MFSRLGKRECKSLSGSEWDGIKQRRQRLRILTLSLTSLILSDAREIDLRQAEHEDSSLFATHPPGPKDVGQCLLLTVLIYNNTTE